MITARLIKLVRSLADHKGRREERLFVAEGSKCVCDTIGFFRPSRLFATPDWLEAHPAEAASAVERGAVVEECKKGQSTCKDWRREPTPTANTSVSEKSMVSQSP